MFTATVGIPLLACYSDTGRVHSVGLGFISFQTFIYAGESHWDHRSLFQGWPAASRFLGLGLGSVFSQQGPIYILDILLNLHCLSLCLSGEPAGRRGGVVEEVRRRGGWPPTPDPPRGPGSRQHRGHQSSERVCCSTPSGQSHCPLKGKAVNQQYVCSIN